MRFVGIDPSTKTGFVALDEDGTVVKQKELTGIGTVDPKRMCTLHDEAIAHIKNYDVICIEGFSFNSTGQGVDFQYGLGHYIRNTLWRREKHYYEVAPSAVKKFVGVTGWKGEVGKKSRLSGSEKKKAVAEGVLSHFGFTHPSDNVVDAFIMAQIARAIHHVKCENNSFILTDYQMEVVQNILNPKPKSKTKKKRKKAKV